MRLKDIMTRDVEVVAPHATLKDAARKMKELDVGLVPVCDHDKITGMLTDRDITVKATAEGRNPMDTRVSEIMSPNVAYCFEDQHVEEAMAVMELKQIRRLPIMSRDKRLVGIVSLGDLAVHTHDEALAGEVLAEVSEPSRPRR
jgi:CBS domain-containing protein